MSISAVGASSTNSYQVTRAQAQASQTSAPVDADGDHDGDTAATEPGKGAAVDVSA